MNLSVKDAAGLLSVSEKTIYRWIKQEIVPAYRVNEQYRFNRAELLEWATSRRISLPPDSLQEPETEAQPLPFLGDALENGGIFYRIEGKKRSDVLASAVAHLRLPEEIDRAYLLQVLLARERLASTGIGEGIAIPHPRNPALLQVSRPTVTLCFLESAAPWRSLDGRPVKILFIPIAPTLRAHLHLLSTLGFALREADFRTTVAREAGREEILSAVRRVEAELGKDSA